MIFSLPLVVVLAAVLQLVRCGSIPLDTSIFYELVEAAENPFMVLFGAPAEQDQDQSFETFSERLQATGVQVGRVNCLDKKKRKLCAGFGATLPQVAL